MTPGTRTWGVFATWPVIASSRPRLAKHFNARPPARKERQTKPEMARPPCNPFGAPIRGPQSRAPQATAFRTVRFERTGAGRALMPERAAPTLGRKALRVKLDAPAIYGSIAPSRALRITTCRLSLP